jgi:predicted nucleic acid-binding protein
MIAVVCGWHTHHEQAVAEITRRLKARQQMVIAGPALVETYSVLTRLPSPHRLSSVDARTLIHANFIDDAAVVALDSRRYCELITNAPEAQIAGGRVYDAVIAACAAAGSVFALLTFNRDDFNGLVDDSIEIVVPEL